MNALAFHGIQSGAHDLDLETMVDGFGNFYYHPVCRTRAVRVSCGRKDRRVDEPNVRVLVGSSTILFSFGFISTEVASLIGSVGRHLDGNNLVV